MKQFDSVLHTLKKFTQSSMERIKTVGVKEAFLTAGIPDKKEVLYEEIVKREKEALKAEQKAEREAKKAQKEREKARKKAAQEAKKSTQKTKSSSSKKSPTSKKKTTTKKETSTTKSSTTKTTKKTVENKSTAATTTTKKTVAKKPVAKTSTTSKATTDKKSPTKKVSSSNKTTTASKKTTTKKVATKTTKTTKPAGSKRAEKIALYAKDIKKHYGEVDEAFLTIIVKNLGPSIYRRDAELVSCSDPKELDTVRRNFLIKKLGIDASKAVLDAAIQDVCTELKGVRTKYRATFYYTLAKKFKKESALS